LKKLLKKFTYFVYEVGKDEDNSDCEKLARAFLQELTIFEIPLLELRKKQFLLLLHVAYN
jgi:THO complex subunit 7